ncbi:MAG TPA: hypothetical protein VHM00_05465 [Caldimonas sp.]|jgi:hypothetical protein|nr:hypothetical protein [Caldimonas sp.]HEX2540512.1 hypothetical protein [Caldimonas sp.]
MHLLVPFASDLSEACQHVLRDLALPNLERLLGLLTPVARDEGEATSLSPPHERALAALRGWRGSDGTLPFAAHSAAADGIDVGGTAWALLTPGHWQLGRDDVVLLDPESIEMERSDSAALFESLRPQFESEGFRTAWGDPRRWYAGRDDLDGFATASPDRVIGRDVDRWLRDTGAGLPEAQRSTGRLVRRLQSEAQLLFHEHPVNDAREQRGLLPINSFWFSGCGRLQATDPRAEPDVALDLRQPLLAGDWARWAEAWRGLDAGALATLAARAGAGEPVALTLCGERHAARFESRARPLLERLRSAWRKSAAHDVLAAL